MNTPYTLRVFDSFDRVSLADWRRVCSASGDPFFMDSRFVSAVEAGLREVCEFWHVLIYDGNGAPVACASLSTVTIDLVTLAHPAVGRVIRRFPAALSRFRSLKLFLCGLPVSAGQNSIAMTPDCDQTRALSELDRVVTELASKSGSQTVVYKEFGDGEAEAMTPLLAWGYRRIPTPPMHCLPTSFESFDHYCAALRSHYRYKIQRSVRKLARAGIATAVLTDPEEILRAYTPEAHLLYHQVLDRSETRVETLPIEFFQELTRRLPDEVTLIVLARESRIVAFAWSLNAAGACHLLFVGLDYPLNDECDLYFNLLYAWMDHAFGTQASMIKVGQTTDAFKARLGCYSEPCYVFTKGVGAVMSLVNRGLAGLAVAQESAPPALRVFKSEQE